MDAQRVAMELAETLGNFQFPAPLERVMEEPEEFIRPEIRPRTGQTRVNRPQTGKVRIPRPSTALASPTSQASTVF